MSLALDRTAFRGAHGHPKISVHLGARLSRKDPHVHAQRPVLGCPRHPKMSFSSTQTPPGSPLPGTGAGKLCHFVWLLSELIFSGEKGSYETCLLSTLPHAQDVGLPASAVGTARLQHRPIVQKYLRSLAASHAPGQSWRTPSWTEAAGTQTKAPGQDAGPAAQAWDSGSLGARSEVASWAPSVRRVFLQHVELPSKHASL